MMEQYVVSKDFPRKKNPIPQVNVGRNILRFNKAFEERYLRDAKAVRLFFGRKDRTVLVMPMSYHKNIDLKLSKNLTGSSCVSFQGFLKRYGLYHTMNGNRQFKVWDNPTGEGAFFQLA